MYDLDLNGFAMTFTGTDKNVTISNLNILAGSTGGAISNRGALNIDSAQFENNTVIQSGAVSHVRNQSYGLMMGFDFPMFVTKNDWKLFSTIYGAYIGSSQQYENSNMYQNGGYGGYLLSLYKNNFYAGQTINGGGVAVENHYLGKKMIMQL